MAITRTETQITWDTGSNSKSVSASSNGTSDAMSVDASCIAAQLHLYADNAGTPAAGDTVDFYLVQTGGDPIGTGSDVYDSTHASHAVPLGRIDTNAGDPAQITVPLPLPQKAFKVYAVNNDAGSAATVGGTITELRG